MRSLMILALVLATGGLSNADEPKTTSTTPETWTENDNVALDLGYSYSHSYHTAPHWNGYHSSGYSSTGRSSYYNNGGSYYNNSGGYRPYYGTNSYAGTSPYYGANSYYRPYSGYAGYVAPTTYTNPYQYQYQQPVYTPPSYVVTNPHYNQEAGYYNGYWEGYWKTFKASDYTGYQYKYDWQQYNNGTAFRYYDTRGTSIRTWTDGNGVTFNLGKKEGSSTTATTTPQTWTENSNVQVNVGKKETGTKASAPAATASPTTQPPAATTATTTPTTWVVNTEVQLNLGRKRK